jgi:sorting nexin-13
MEHLIHFDQSFSGIRSINELVEYILLAAKDDNLKGVGSYQSTNVAAHPNDHPLTGGGVCNDDPNSRKYSSSKQGTDITVAKTDHQRETSLDYSTEESMKYRSADWARHLEAATQRRTEVLTPENLENLWTKGRNYKKKEHKNIKAGFQDHIVKGSGIVSVVSSKDLGKEMLTNKPEISIGTDGIAVKQLTHAQSIDNLLSVLNKTGKLFPQDHNKELSFGGGRLVDELEHTTSLATDGNKSQLKRSNSTSALIAQPSTEKKFTEERGKPIILEFYSPNFGRRSGEHSGRSASDVVLQSEAQQAPKLRCRVSILLL